MALRAGRDFPKDVVVPVAESKAARSICLIPVGRLPNRSKRKEALS
jgi:hypothetical protein